MRPDFLPRQPSELEERQAYADIELGDKARAILNDPLVKQYFDNIKQDCFDRWCKTTEPHHRDEIWQLMWAVEKLKAQFQGTIAIGTQAAQQVTVWQRLRETFRRAG